MIRDCPIITCYVTSHYLMCMILHLSFISSITFHATKCDLLVHVHSSKSL